MRIFYNLDDMRERIPHPAVTVGSFDGVHAGHRAILSTLKEAALRNGGESVVVTFNPHPRQVLQSDDSNLKLLNSPEEKIYLLQRAGIDNLLVIPFTREFSRMDSETFARRYLLEGIGAETIVMGYNHQFGRRREGDRDYLESLRDKYGFEIVQLPKQQVDQRKVSSTVLRFLINAGELKSARELLTEPYFFIAQRGTCGLLEYDEPLKIFPPEGTYPVSVDDGENTFETNLLLFPDNKLGLPFPVQSHCRPGQKLIVRFRDLPRDADGE